MRVAPGIHRIGYKAIINSYLVEESGEEATAVVDGTKSRRTASRPSSHSSVGYLPRRSAEL
jgi:hypothetical protein